jgi:cytochrome c oxidase cbb3-type subunit III
MTAAGAGVVPDTGQRESPMNYRLKLWTAVVAAAATWVVQATAQAPRPPMPRAGVGPADRPSVDPDGADRGRAVWIKECITCHGTQARGTDTAPSLLRSLVILKDRYGSQLGPFLKKGHPMQSGAASTTLTDAQITDLTHFVRQRIEDTLRGSTKFTEGNILVGDAAAGAAYFNGDGKCATCHNATTNSLAGVSSRFSGTVDLQQRMLFPGGRGGRGAPAGAPSPSAVRVTLTPTTGPSMSGVLIEMDDLVVTFREESGTIRVVRRVPGLKIVKNDPLQAHHELLDRISDKNIHDLVAHLETMK